MRRDHATHRVAAAGLAARTRALPALARYAATAAIVLAVFLVRRAADPILGDDHPFLLFFVAVLLAAALFNHWTGLLATGLSALLVGHSYLPPVDQLGIEDSRQLVALAAFVAVGAAMALVIETLHNTVAHLQRTVAELRRSENVRALLLREFRHRIRNDLGALVGLLTLRARTAPSAAAREGLLDAAAHAMALARVHGRLALAEEGFDAGGQAAVDTREFVAGLCADIEAAQFGEGLRPVALVVEAEAHSLPADRAVPLGLVLNETVTNALKYAFPEERPGTVRVRFAREGAEFSLTVIDDGIGLPKEGNLDRAPPAPAPQGSGLGTRLLRALAAQLRGTFTRRPGERGVGTCAELRFPAATAGPSSD